MLSCEQVKEIIEAGIPGAAAEVSDLTGTSEHFNVRVVSGDFAGKSVIQQHKMVHEAVKDHFGDGKPIHALQIKTSAE